MCSPSKPRLHSSGSARRTGRRFYAYVRRCGHDADSARDLTQGFFAQLIEKRRLTHADRERGRFRTFLLSAMQNFLRNELDRAQALKRGGGREVISLDQQEAEEHVLHAAPEGLTPERLFEKRWASRLRELSHDLDDVWVYFNNDGHGYAVRNALRLRELVESS